MPEQPSSTTRVETSLPIAQWLVHLCVRPFLPDVAVGTHSRQLGFSCFFSVSQLLSRKVSNSQKEEVCQQMAYKSFLYRPQPDLVPSAATSETMQWSCLRTTKGMHLLLKGQSEEKRRRSPLLPSESMCTFNGHWGLWSKGWSYMVYAW